MSYFNQTYNRCLAARNPDLIDSPYFMASDMEHHYPNLYDFQRATMFNSPGPLYAPFNRPLFVPRSRPSYMREEDYRVRSDWLSIWGNAAVRHNNTSLANLD
ncbi:unnamed protein product [Lymnaea stagnalis]|uniref:Uncharacterized protein n=1 Tax=Lymnaea stagnalis TaxID=6523 RepID=A0AAV2HVZ8_LYMST